MNSNRILRSVAMLAWLMLATTTLAGCNTVRGAGKDIEKAGEVVQDAAEDASR